MARGAATSRRNCFTTAFSGSPNGFSFYTLPLTSKLVHTSGDNRQASDVWQTLLEFALKLTSAKRSFVFFCDDNSELQLRAGLDESGQQIKEDATVLQMIKLTSSHDLRVNGPDP